MACDSHSYASTLEQPPFSRIEAPLKSTYDWRRAALAKRKRVLIPQRQCSMPVQIANGYHSSHMPSFPPTLEEEPGNSPENRAATQHSSQISGIKEDTNNTHSSEILKQQKPILNHASLHLHRDSTSTASSDSSASSPTTTVSPAESYNNNNDTPITSPDTPASTLSLSSFTLANQVQPSEKPEGLRQPPAPRPSVASKKPRNLKGLAVDTSSAAHFGRALVTASVPPRVGPDPDPKMIRVPSSPAFVKPAKPVKRKGSNLGLSIVTPASNSPPVQEISEVPPTPSLVRPHALRHFPSSPTLPLQSPSVPPEGGMKLPPIATRRSVNVGFAEAPQEKDEEESNFDVPQSAGPKPQAYPDGPICIYDPHVYLFYEPPADVARCFDVVVNVANEVKNPFNEPHSAPTTETSRVSLASSPTTPKAGRTGLQFLSDRPEYIHIPWEHNTDIVPDLYELVKLVDERVQDGKRVLIHCQLGVSRSASLIVAYGLFKNPSMTVQEAYDAVKRRSKWISPNISLIMQLQEFRTELMKQSAGMPKRGFSHRRQTSKTKLTSLGPVANLESPVRRSQDRERQSEESGPRSAPLPPDDESHKALSISTEKDAVTPGPSSAPSGFAWPSDHASGKLLKEEGSHAPASSLPTGSASAHAVAQAPGSSVSNISTPSLYSPQSQSSENSSQFSALQTHAPPAPFRESSGSFSKASPPHLKPLNLPVNHISRFHSSNNGLGMAQPSPRSLEFGLNPAQPPTPDDTLGLTSPRVSSFQSLHTSLHPSPPQPSALSNPSTVPLESAQPTKALEVPQRQPPRVKPILPPDNLASIAEIDTAPQFNQTSTPSVPLLTSPRATEFAMAGIGPPTALQNDNSFGLTSPRENLSFAQQMQLPHGRPKLPPHLFSAREKAFASLRPPTSSLEPHGRRSPSPAAQAHSGSHDTGASDRRKLRSKLGMSTSSSYDMRSEYVLAGKARQLVSPSAQGADDKPESFHSALTTQDDMDALMSPRATEFTRNPFADALGVAVADQPQSSVIAAAQTTTEEDQDPRSPVQDPGSSPIVRNIADVFS